ncbi:MAG: glycerol-3-phosphate 1-O-acyltransferase PlsY [Clostridia bacterium]|nr:glycerol-3-phosphate 1-O-acyltransferase PlsY [Clostridia bacterium]
MNFLEWILMIIIGYIIGSIPFSYLIPKWLGRIDIRQHGSGNTGTTNVVRTLGLRIGIVAFLGDFIKGIIPTVIGFVLFSTLGGIVGGSFAILGHCYSIWLKFKGGKGIATSAGVLVILMPLILIILLTIQFIIIFATKIMSLASISSAILLPILTALLYSNDELLYFSFFLAIFVIFKHKDNIKRLVKGEENKLSIKKK